MTVDSYVLTHQALNKIHSHSMNNKVEVTSSDSCCCFYCKSRFSSTDITQWVDNGNTALCPRCAIDSVIGDKSGVPMTDSLLEHMHDFWFERQVFPDDFDYSWFEPVKEDA